MNNYEKKLDAIIQLFASLNEILTLREKQVLSYRFGFHVEDYYRKHSLKETQKFFKVGDKQIRQVEIKAFEKISEKLSDLLR